MNRSIEVHASGLLNPNLNKWGWCLKLLQASYLSQTQPNRNLINAYRNEFGPLYLAL